MRESLLVLVIFFIFEFCRIAFELGGYFIEADPRSWEHIDLTILRIRVGVKSKEVVLSCWNMTFVEDDGSYRFYDDGSYKFYYLLFQVEDETIFQRTHQY
jgi:hypothetical protein